MSFRPAKKLYQRTCERALSQRGSPSANHSEPPLPAVQRRNRRAQRLVVFVLHHDDALGVVLSEGGRRVKEERTRAWRKGGGLGEEGRGEMAAEKRLTS